MSKYLRIILSAVIEKWFKAKNHALAFFHLQRIFHFDLLDGALLIRSCIISRGFNNRIIIGKRSTLRNLAIEINGSNNIVLLGEYVKFYESGKILFEGSNCKLQIGDKSTIGSAEFLFGESDTKITIGKDCMLSRRISFNTSDFHSIIDIKTGQRINNPANICVSDSVWIGNGVYLNKGAVVGTGTIIAANSVVPKGRFPKNVILGGVPARVLKVGVSWVRERL